MISHVPIVDETPRARARRVIIVIRVDAIKSPYRFFENVRRDQCQAFKCPRSHPKTSCCRRPPVQPFNLTCARTRGPAQNRHSRVHPRRTHYENVSTRFAARPRLRFSRQIRIPKIGRGLLNRRVVVKRSARYYPRCRTGVIWFFSLKTVGFFSGRRIRLTAKSCTSYLSRTRVYSIWRRHWIQWNNNHVSVAERYHCIALEILFVSERLTLTLCDIQPNNVQIAYVNARVLFHARRFHENAFGVFSPPFF